MARIGSALLLTVTLLGGTPVPPAGAAFPGANGKIAFQRPLEGVYAMNADGSGQTNLSYSSSDSSPTGPPTGRGSRSKRSATGTARST